MEPSKSTVVKERAIANLVQASIKRKDKKDIQLKQFKQITVHRCCQTSYTRESNIKIALKSFKKKWRDCRRRSENAREFDFSTYCFFCCNRVHATKQPCKSVSKQFTIDNILAQLDVYEANEQNKAISSRLMHLKYKDDAYYEKNNVSYHAKCLTTFYKYSASNIQGRPISENMNNFLCFIINYILENSDECQFSMKMLHEKYVSKNGPYEFPRLERIENLLKQHFDDEIVIYRSNNDIFICFKQTLGQCIDESWYTNRKTNDREEKLRIIELAAHIILQDIRSIKFDLNTYNSPTDFLSNVATEIPETLKLFLDILIKTHKHVPNNESWAKWDNKIITMSHMLMTAVRPRSFSSSILLGLSCMMHTKFSAKGLIDCLYNIGLCASYSETIRFETSIVNDPDNFNFISDTYLQFVYDNADHNTATIDGKNTFHCMGGIMCVTPSSSITFNTKFPRIKGALSLNNTNNTGFLPLTDFKNNKPFKLDSVIVRNWKETEHIDFKLQIKPIDLLYFYGKHAAPEKTPNWHGFMNKFHSTNIHFTTSRVIALPFINAPPSDHTTILTALIDARHRANKNNQQHCFVTFDLPLYMKASEIVSSIEPDNDPHNIRSVIPRLGGFHLAMSFLGAIGNIMTGSGLKEAFCSIYAELSADKALTGHAFSRAVRGHLLVQAALATIIFKQVQLTDNEKAQLNETLEKVGEENFENLISDPFLTDVTSKFVSVFNNLENNGPTSQLWVQYFKLICLLQKFIDAERSGNFNLHIEMVQQMIPFFFASGHHLYAKACLLYVQQMLNLRNIMDVIEYDKFCNQGFNTIRRSNRFWCGIWSDMTIEQVLMRAIKCTGGLTHGRGLTENVIGKWISSRVAVLEVGNAMELFCNMSFATSEQHVDNRVSRLRKDTQDLEKVQQFFENFNPFPESDKIIGIFSGIIGDLSTVNCHRAFEIGRQLMNDVSNKKFTDVKYKRINKVVHLAAANSSIKNIANEEVYISPLLIFQKISLNIKNQDDMKEYCSSYELSPIPLALFDENGMRKTTKSVFYANFHHSNEITIVGNTTHVIDGGFLLHKVVWQSNLKIDAIVNSYVSYVKNHYAANSYIIFDGYPDDESESTKSVERSRRQLKNVGREIAFDSNTTISVSQKQFLSNEKNKMRVIEKISSSLNAAGFRTKIAEEDADRLIVVTAIENARLDSDTTVIIVGEDIDLLVILSQLAQNSNNIFFVKESKGAKPREYYTADSFKHKSLQQIVCFLHAFCGCDTTSCFYRVGKNRLIDSFSHEELVKLASVFYKQNANCDEIAQAAFELIKSLYSSKAEKKLLEKSSSFTLNDLRFLHFSKAKLKTKFALETLPPTEGAAMQHAFRVYYQIQKWLGNTALKAVDWGWKVRNNYLVPVGSADPPIPKKLLEQISCSCSKKGCVDASCSCKKHGLRCTNLCGNCNDDTCCNLEKNNRPFQLEDECEVEDDEQESMDFQSDYNTDEDDIPSKKTKIL